MTGWEAVLEDRPQAREKGAHAPSLPAAAMARTSHYAVAAVEAECREVRATSGGSRNARLNRAAFSLGQIVASRAIDRGSVVRELRAAALDAGLGSAEIDATIASGMAAGAEEPRAIPPPRARTTGASAEEPPPDPYADAADVPPDGTDGGEQTRDPSTGPRHSATVADVLDEWSMHGPLIHEPTAIARLDELTGGGPVYGSRWYVAGAPDAGKTALVVQIAHVYALRGVAVGLLAVDEEAGDLVTRLAQRVGYGRGVLEARSLTTIDGVRHELRDLPIRLYDATWTIESAASDLALYAQGRATADPAAHPHGPRATLAIDSLQTVTCGAETTAGSERGLSTAEAVTARVHAIRAVATRYRLIALCTSEMGRGAYAQRNPDDRTATLAAAKWSGAVEYSARVLLGLRSVAGEADLLEIDVAKNKHGPSGELVHLRIDRRCQALTEVSYEPPPPAHADVQRAGRKTAELVRAAAHLAVVLAGRPGIVTRDMPPAARAEAGSMSEATARAALARLGEAVVKVPGSRGARHLYLDGRRVSADVLALVSATHRGTVEAARPPSESA